MYEIEIPFTCCGVHLHQVTSVSFYASAHLSYWLHKHSCEYLTIDKWRYSLTLQQHHPTLKVYKH